MRNLAPVVLALLLSNCTAEKPVETHTAPLVSPDESNGATLTGKVAFTGDPAISQGDAMMCIAGRY